jgi:predicted phage tail protein
MHLLAQLAFRGGKGGTQKPKPPFKAPDSALSIARAKLLYMVSEGEIAGPVNAGQSVKLDGTPLVSPDGTENFPGTTWDFRSGTVDQDHIPGFPAIDNEHTAGFPVELKYDTPWTRAVTNPELSAIRIRLSWPQIWQVTANGDQFGYRIDYAIDLAIDGGSFQEYLTATVDDKGTTEYERSHRVDLPEGFSSAMVRVRRLTPNRNDNNFADIMRIKALTEVIDAKLRYPNLALLALQFDASQFSNIPKFSLHCRGRIIQVPSNYEPETRAYLGNWDGTFKLAYSNCPPWVWYDLLLHRRYGLGRRITPDMVDRWTLYEIGRYCDVMVPDGKGGLEPRMTTNVYIQDQVEGYALLSDLASVFRGSSCWNGSQVTLVADIPGNEDGYVFSRSNIVGEFEYGATAWPDRHTRAKVSWDNPANDFKTEPVAVTNDEMIGVLGHRLLDINRFACTSEGEAMRHGVWALKTEQHESWTVRFITGMEGRNVEPGQIICVADELLSGRPNGGRISAATRRVITLDIDAQVQPEDRLILNLPSGKPEGRIVKSANGREVTVMADYSELPEAQCSWSIESADLTVMRFRVQTVEPNGPHQWEITGLQHEPSKYDAIDHGARIDPQPISIIPPGVMDAPASVQIEARSIVVQGLAVTTMRISWPTVKGAIAYNVEWRKNNGSWIRLPRTGALGCEVEGIYAGAYTARVSAINAVEVSSLFTTSPVTTLNGKEGVPPAVSSLVTSSLLFGIGLRWSFPERAEDTQRSEIWYSQAPALETANKLSDLAYPQRDYMLQNLKAGATFYFWARLVDRTGNIGPFYPVGTGVQGIASADAAPVLDLIAGQIGETELGKELLDEIGKIPGLQDQIDGLESPLAYVPEDTYAAGAIVYQGDRLYQATVEVPAAADGSHAPPNASYWDDIGQVLIKANAVAGQVMQNTLELAQQGEQLTAQASKLDGVYVQVNPAQAGAEEGWAGSDEIYVGVWSEQSARLEDGITTAQRIDQVQARVNDTSAAVQVVSKAVASLDGKASAMWAVKLQVNSLGQYVATGVGLGIENIDGVLQSQFLVSADRFAVVSSVAGGAAVSPFAIQGGQVFMNSAIIQDASINFVKISDTLQSTAVNSQGLPLWRLGKTDSFELNGSGTGFRREMRANYDRYYDTNTEVLFIEIGELT